MGKKPKSNAKYRRSDYSLADMRVCVYIRVGTESGTQENKLRSVPLTSSIADTYLRKGAGHEPKTKT
jgi:hypothetical protein